MEIISTMEQVIKGLKDQNQDQAEKSEREIKDLKESSDKEINELQKSIEELNKRLKKYERTKEELRTFTEKQASGEKITPKAVMKSEAEKIKKLEAEINEMRLALKIANAVG